MFSPFINRDSERLSEVADLRNQLQNRDDSIRSLEQQSERISTDYQQQKELLQTVTSENETLKSSNESQCKVNVLNEYEFLILINFLILPTRIDT